MIAMLLKLNKSPYFWVLPLSCFLYLFVLADELLSVLVFSGCLATFARQTRRLWPASLQTSPLQSDSLFGVRLLACSTPSDLMHRVTELWQHDRRFVWLDAAILKCQWAPTDKKESPFWSCSWNWRTIPVYQEHNNNCCSVPVVKNSINRVADRGCFLVAIAAGQWMNFEKVIKLESNCPIRSVWNNFHTDVSADQDSSRLLLYRKWVQASLSFTANLKGPVHNNEHMTQ